MLTVWNIVCCLNASSLLKNSFTLHNSCPYLLIHWTNIFYIVPLILYKLVALLQYYIHHLGFLLMFPHHPSVWSPSSWSFSNETEDGHSFKKLLKYLETAGPPSTLTTQTRLSSMLLWMLNKGLGCSPWLPSRASTLIIALKSSMSREPNSSDHHPSGVQMGFRKMPVPN